MILTHCIVHNSVHGDKACLGAMGNVISLILTCCIIIIVSMVTRNM